MAAAQSEKPKTSAAAEDPLAHKKVAFEMRDKPWPAVLEWLADQSELPFAGIHKPTGTFTYIGPKQGKTQHTIPEVIDILNEALTSQKFVIIRRTASFTVLPADEKIPPEMLPRLTIPELESRGKTEIAQVVLPLHSQNAEDIVGEVKKMMGPFGEVVALSVANQLILQDAAGNLRQIIKTLQDTEEAAHGQSYTHPCKNIKAKAAVETLTKALGDPLELIRATTPQQPRGFGGGGFGGNQQQPAQPAALALNLPKFRMFHITADEASNSVIVNGPANIIASAKEILKKIDVPQLETSPVVLIPLNVLEAAKTVETLKGMLVTDKNSGPYLEADTNRNAVIVGGSQEQITSVKMILKALGEGAEGSEKMRVITLDKGSAATLADALQRLMQQLRQNPVNVIVPGGEQPKAPKPEQKPERPSRPTDRGVRGIEGDTLPIAQQLVDPQSPPAQKPANPSKAPPINIMPFGNRLVITSDDPDALKLVQEMVRLLTQTPGGEGDFEVIKLKNASATDAAKVLDEAFNGTKPTTGQQNPGFPGFFNRFGNQGAQPPANPQPNRLRVVADPGTNSLLVRASPLDMMTVRRLLEKAIDSGETDSKAVLRNWVIALKNANAAEVASMIKDVYRESMNNDPLGGRGGIRGFNFGAPPTRNLDAQGNPRGVSLSISVDDRSNRLILVCSERLYDDIKKLVDELDKAALNAMTTVELVRVKGIDPLVIQQAIDALQGRRPTQQMPGQGQGRGNGFGNGFQGGGGRGFGGGGMGQGGGGRGPGGGGLLPGADDRGPDFFEHGVMEDPQSSVLFDPQLDATTFKPGSASSAQQLLSSDRPAGNSAIQLAHFEEEQQQPAQAPSPSDLQGPRGQVTADAVPGTDAVIVRAQNKADAEAVRLIIERITEIAKDAEVKIELVPLEHGDATAVTNALTQLFQRVTVGPGGNVRNTATTPTFGGAGTGAGAAGGFGAAPTAATTASQQASSSVFLEAIPRFNAILVAAPKIRFDDVKKEIKRLDAPNPSVGRMVAFHLTQAPSSRVATFLTNLFASRYVAEGAAQDQIRFTHDDSSNTVFVQASPADLQDIAELIKVQDTAVSSAINEVRVISLKNATSDEIATLLSTAISQGITNPTTTPTTPTGVPGAGGLPGAAVRPAGTALPGGATAPFGTGTPTVPGATSATGTAATGGLSTKSMTLRLFSKPGESQPESGLLEDIHITSYPRINSLIIEAPSRSMALLQGLINRLDVPPTARADMKVFTLQNADAQSMSLMLQQLFLGATGTTTTPTGAGGFAGAGGGGFGGAGGVTGTTTVTPAVQNPGGQRAYPAANITLGGYTPEGAPIIPLSISTDVRTNSVIVAGARNDVDAVYAIITRLDEDTSVQERHTECYHLRNASAADVATALQSLLTQQLQQYSVAQQLTAYKEYQRGVVVVAEPVSNNLLLSVTKDYFPIVMRLISDLDAQPPQVVIQVLVAEVDLTATEEFGVEVGLQSPILFSRSVIPAPGSTGAVSYTNPATGGGLTPIGVTVTGSNNPAASPGYNFNNANFFANPLGNNPLASPGIVGFQGLNNLGVGRSDSSGLGGFVFSAASNSFNLLIRALKTQGRLDVLSRPQIQTMDGQTALLNVGQEIPYISASNVTATGVISNTITYKPVGVILQVTPRISPDGTVIMRVIPEVSSVAATQTPLGNGETAVAFNTQHFESTVFAQDGETVALGGVIVRNDQKNENKIPWLGDLPGVGALFRYRTQNKSRQELLVILTPHIVRTRQEADRILAEEARRMEWCIDDVIKTQGPTGLEPILPPVKGNAGNGHGGMSIPGPGTILIPPPSTTPAPSVPTPRIESPQVPRETLPEPRKQPAGQEKPANQGAMAAPDQSPAAAVTQGTVQQTSANQATDGQSATPPTEEKHKWYWSLFHRDQ